MQTADRVLLSGGILTGAASLLHLAIIVGGPPWYRFFGAGERMARLAGRGSLYPAAVTACIALLLGLCALYALSGAGTIRRLPLLRFVLPVAATVYLARGALGIPVVLIMDTPYANELKAKMPLMGASSAVCLLLGVCYAVGAASVWKRMAAPRAS